MYDTLEPTNDPADRRTRACVDRLRRLPPEVLPPYNWQEFQRRARGRSLVREAYGQGEASQRDGDGAREHPPVMPEHQPVSTNRRSRWQLAAAVALLLVVCGAALWGRFGGGVRSQLPEWTDSAGVSTLMPRDTHLSGGLRSPARAQDSQAIESWLASLPPEPIVVHVGTRAAVARLEDRIAQVDDLLTVERIDGVRPDRLAELQQERIRLVGSLAQVRYAEVVASELP